ncbi:hypothetical protein [Streptomyces niveus]|uniref:hypothetical protein n=1 Tax=Streptomyces niveus TaxID=193462 RepID=UPI0036D34CAB
MPGRDAAARQDQVVNHERREQEEAVLEQKARRLALAPSVVAGMPGRTDDARRMRRSR